MSKTHFKKLQNPDFLGAYSLDDGKDIILTIDYVRQEKVTGSDGKSEECIVCHWKEQQKPMILNSTNCKMIAKLIGSPYIEDWSGKKIQIGSERVKAFGDVVDALRVRKFLPKQTESSAPLHCEICGSIIEGAVGLSAEQFAMNTRKKFGKNLCMDCAMAEKEKLDSARGGDK